MFDTFFTYFWPKKENNNLNKSINFFESNECSNFNAETDDSDDCDDPSEYDSNVVQLKLQNTTFNDSPFYTFFNEHVQQFYKEMEINDSNKPTNLYYNKELIDYMLTNLFPYYPLWSAVICKDFAISRDSNAPIENWMKILKKDMFLQKKKILLPRFVQNLGRILDARLKERKYKLYRSRRARKSFNKEKDIDLTTEEWMRKGKGKRRENMYFKMKKNIEETMEIVNTNTNQTADLNETVMDNSVMNKSINVNDAVMNDSIEEKISFDNLLVKQFLSSNTKYPTGFPKLYKTIANIIVSTNVVSILSPLTHM